MARILENTSKWELWGIRGKSVGEPMDDGDGKNPSGGIGHKWGGLGRHHAFSLRQELSLSVEKSIMAHLVSTSENV